MAQAHQGARGFQCSVCAGYGENLPESWKTGGTTKRCSRVGAGGVGKNGARRARCVSTQETSRAADVGCVRAEASVSVRFPAQLRRVLVGFMGGGMAFT